MANNIISIILPLYNAENTIRNTIINILDQTYINFELLIINDCSSDNSLALAQSFNDKRIKIFNNKKNEGAGFSRNIGIKNSKGGLICFIDADDRIDNNYLYELYNSYVNCGADIVVCDIEVYGKTKKRQSFKFKDKKELINNPLVASPCAKLFDRELFKECMFCEGIINEDIATIIPIIVRSDKISYCEKCCYKYVQNNDSVQNSRFSEKKFDVLKAVEISLERIYNFPNYEEYKEIIIFNQIIMFFFYMLMEVDNNTERLNYLKMFKNKLSYNLIDNKYIVPYLEKESKFKKNYYYNAIKLFENNHLLILNNLIGLFQIARTNKNRHTVIKQNITIDDIVTAAQKQNKLAEEEIRISVVVPNYNYESFLLERIYSILNQNFKIHELILLDDFSTDCSTDLLDEVCFKVSSYINVKKEYNKKNSGHVFSQWEKGFNLCYGDYIWIAEADDYSNCLFLKELTREIIKSDKNISLAYCNTYYINTNGNIIYKKVKKLIDIQKTGHWNRSFENDGLDELENYSYLNCTIPNVSSVLFKNEDYSKILNIAKTFKQVGDWYFYNNVMLNGDVLYLNKAYNFYRVHGDNTTTNTNKFDFLHEINKVYNWEMSVLHLNDEKIKKINERLEFLKNEWNLEV